MNDAKKPVISNAFTAVFQRGWRKSNQNVYSKRKKIIYVLYIDKYPTFATKYTFHH